MQTFKKPILSRTHYALIANFADEHALKFT